MRLLKFSTGGELSEQEFFDDNIPPYAILSHTWGADSDEVTFRNLKDGSGKTKPGNGKIQFCGKQARKDGLEYFWVDTCCIDKSSSTELSEAINSMFSWFRNAAKCYVYLSDVSQRTRKRKRVDDHVWESAFRNSRWFTRGWTVTELIAPTSVEFFSLEGELVGDKKLLERQIHEITKIPVTALRGAPLSEFSIIDRLGWMGNRATSRKEDMAYCLMGMFDVNMPLLYGEGERAFSRLRKKIDERSKIKHEEFTNDRSFLADESLRYHPLANSGFRLFVLDPGGTGTDIIGRIQEYSLRSPPVYYALSYVWGQEPKIHRVNINGKAKFIQPNLFHALQRIRLRTGQYHIWVDSLCINQSDGSERNMQVRQMAKIYGKASGVLIWLGEEDSTSRFALEFASKIISNNFKWDDSWWTQHGFLALAQILERPWFRRGWVLQEAAFSKNSILHCGDREVYMDDFVMAVNTVRDRLSTVPTSLSLILANFRNCPAIKFVDTIRGAFRASVRGDFLRRRLSLETLVDLTTSSETTDQRDAIYSLLNLANDITSVSGPNQSDAIIPDYGKPVLDVFVDFILHCCCHSGSLDIICRPWAPVSSSSVYAVGKETGLDHNLKPYPSWIASRDGLPFGHPSWNSKHRLHGNPLVGGSRKRAYNAHYGSKPQVSAGRSRFGICDGSLYARGLVLGEIGERSTRMANAIITKECLGILRSISLDAESGLVDLPGNIWRTLCADRDEEGQRAPLSYAAAMLHLLKMKSEIPEPGSPTDLLNNMSSIDLEELLDTDIPENVEEFLTTIRNVIWNRRTFCSKVNDSTGKLLVGLIPQNAKLGDQVCILYGCSVPVILRQAPRDGGEPDWQLIGDAYVHEFMDGEAISSASSDRREAEFKII